jgi:hypothetical protein
MNTAFSGPPHISDGDLHHHLLQKQAKKQENGDLTQSDPHDPRQFPSGDLWMPKNPAKELQKPKAKSLEGIIRNEDSKALDNAIKGLLSLITLDGIIFENDKKKLEVSGENQRQPALPKQHVSFFSYFGLAKYFLPGAGSAVAEYASFAYRSPSSLGKNPFAEYVAPNYRNPNLKDRVRYRVRKMPSFGRKGKKLMGYGFYEWHELFPNGSKVHVKKPSYANVRMIVLYEPPQHRSEGRAYALLLPREEARQKSSQQRIEAQPVRKAWRATYTVPPASNNALPYRLQAADIIKPLVKPDSIPTYLQKGALEISVPVPRGGIEQSVGYPAPTDVVSLRENQKAKGNKLERMVESAPLNAEFGKEKVGDLYRDVDQREIGRVVAKAIITQEIIDAAGGDSYFEVMKYLLSREGYGAGLHLSTYDPHPLDGMSNRRSTDWMLVNTMKPTELFLKALKNDRPLPFAYGTRSPLWSKVTIGEELTVLEHSPNLPPVERWYDPAQKNRGDAEHGGFVQYRLTIQPHEGGKTMEEIVVKEGAKYGLSPQQSLDSYKIGHIIVTKPSHANENGGTLIPYTQRKMKLDENANALSIGFNYAAIGKALSLRKAT